MSADGRRRRALPGGAASTGTASPITVAGTGYTGEDGVELAVPAEQAATLWIALLEAGIIPAGPGRP